jgi:hypothetical protein
MCFLGLFLEHDQDSMDSRFHALHVHGLQTSDDFTGKTKPSITFECSNRAIAIIKWSCAELQCLVFTVKQHFSPHSSICQPCHYVAIPIATRPAGVMHIASLLGSSTSQLLISARMVMLVELFGLHAIVSSQTPSQRLKAACICNMSYPGEK